jgi:predicted GTPase
MLYKRIKIHDQKNVLIMGAAGRDFHFNVYFRNNEYYNVAAFTATQIPNIEGRVYPAELAGKNYPKGIKIYEESRLTELIKKFKIDEVVFSYSDVPFNYVMTKASIVNAAGASFRLLGAEETMLKSSKPVVAVGSRTKRSPKLQENCCSVEKQEKGCSRQTSYAYGDLVKQKIQRFAALDDLKKHNCTMKSLRNMNLT